MRHGVSLQRLPPEILLEIFAYCSEDDRDRTNSLKTSMPPWSLASVCCQWRAVVLSAGQFWCDIRFTYEPSEKQPPDHPVWAWSMDLISLQLIRSRECPLKVFMESTDWSSFSELDELNQMLACHSQRWKKLTISDGEGSLYNSLSSSLSPPMNCPLLERFAVYVSHRYWEELDEFPDDLFSGGVVPRLSSASFKCFYPKPFGLPWSQLQELALTDIDEEFSFVTLSKLTNLEFLSVAYCSWDPHINGTCTLPSLKILNVCDAWSIFAIIAAPALDALYVDYLQWELDVAALQSLIRRSQCSITCFQCLLRLDIQLILPLLDVMKGLRSLDIELPLEEARISCGGLAEMLIVRTEDGSFEYCPWLERLSIQWRPDSAQTSLSPMLEMLELRSAELEGFSARLKEVELDDVAEVVWEISDETESRLQALRDGGMSIVVRHAKAPFLESVDLPFDE